MEVTGNAAVTLSRGSIVWQNGYPNTVEGAVDILTDLHSRTIGTPSLGVIIWLNQPRWIEAKLSSQEAFSKLFLNTAKL